MKVTRYIKSTLMVVAGLCWFTVALGIAFLLLQYLAEGAGLQVFGFFFGVSSTTVVIGLVHVVGFAVAAFLSFGIGASICAHAFVPHSKREQRVQKRPKRLSALWRQMRAARRSADNADAVLRCVSCRIALAAPVHICPKCGWTQPYAR